MRAAGVDEAGRGCFIGPLVVTGVSFEEEAIPKLVAMGVKDSKKLTAAKRESLAPRIEELAVGVRYFELQPRSIDTVVTRAVKLKKLNYLEATAMANVIRSLAPDEAYVDASDVDDERYGETILRLLRVKPRMICEHKADFNYPVVSAASILAKVRRDARIAALREEYGDFNSGYPSDEKAILWLRKWYAEHRSFPPVVRESWGPVKKMRLDASQTRLASANA
jgi:ribonuclease HII